MGEVIAGEQNLRDFQVVVFKGLFIRLNEAALTHSGSCLLLWNGPGHLLQTNLVNPGSPLGDLAPSTGKSHHRID